MKCLFGLWGSRREMREKIHSSLGGRKAHRNFELKEHVRRRRRAFGASLTSKFRCARVSRAMKWGAVARGGRVILPGFRHRRVRMSKSKLCLAAALVIPAAFQSTAPARACKSLPHPARQCTVVPASADVRGDRNGRVEYTATGRVLVAGQSKDGLWASIEVPCTGHIGWIARQDLDCEAVSNNAREPAKP